MKMLKKVKQLFARSIVFSSIAKAFYFAKDLNGEPVTIYGIGLDRSGSMQETLPELSKELVDKFIMEQKQEGEATGVEQVLNCIDFSHYLHTMYENTKLSDLKSEDLHKEFNPTTGGTTAYHDTMLNLIKMAERSN